ncbi:MAG: rhodanese y domain superfamily [Geobacteraceae bacterium]|nr:MAG: rhodanese y domain superfamily [Geobacteraceae bacterium]
MKSEKNEGMKKFAVMVTLLSAMTATAIAAGYRNIGSVEAKALLAKNKNVFLLDVRTSEEYRQAHLHGSVLIPINELERRVAEIPRDRTIVVYCAVGSRSVPVAGFLAGKGYRDVYNMSDGIIGWYRNGFAIVR